MAPVRIFLGRVVSRTASSSSARPAHINSRNGLAFTKFIYKSSFPSHLRADGKRFVSTSAVVRHLGRHDSRGGRDGRANSSHGNAEESQSESNKAGAKYENVGHTVPDSKIDDGALSRVTYLGMGSNVLLAVGKGLAGYYSNSQVLIADAVHSVGDLFSDFVTIFALRGKLFDIPQWCETQPHL